MSYHWTDRSKKAVTAREVLRTFIRLGHAKPKASCNEAGTHNEDAEKWPEEFFRCICGSGPWHITWGGICPDCSGAD